MSMWVVIGTTARFLLLISITSEFFFTEHFSAKNSVTPIFLFFRRILFIGQLIIPDTFLFRATYELSLMTS